MKIFDVTSISNFEVMSLIYEGLKDIEKYACIPFTIMDRHKITVIKEDTLVGFIIYDEYEDRIHLNKIYVKPEFRGKGYARALKSYLKEKGKRITLTIHNDNKESLKLFKEAKIYGGCYEII